MYAECSEQYIVSFGGVVGLNNLAIDSILNDYGVIDGKDRIEIRKEVHRLSRMVRKVIDDRSKAK